MSPYLIPGLCDWSKINRSFRNLSDCLGVDYDNQKIKEQISNQENVKRDWEQEKEKANKAIYA